MASMTITVEGPDVVLSTLARGFEDADKTQITPDSMWPGFMLKVTAHSTITEENQ